jgi:NADPH:quinone reductase-like Zn-dependent oxidoreductase
MPSTFSVLEVDRSTPFGELRMVEDRLPEPDPGSILLAVERFSLAANNLSYVLLGDVLRSWDAFPSPTAGRGRVPVWGVATVIDADPAVAAVGAQVSGYLPMATHVVVHAAPTDMGLLTTDEPRARMLPVYRRLTLDEPSIDNDDHRADVDTVMLACYRFAALLSDDLRYAGPRTVVVSSASSRSAAAVTRLLSNCGIEVIGLTSAGHRDAVKSLGVYARVLTYDQVEDVPGSDGTVYVDVAGSEQVTTAVHHHLGDHLEASIAVGGTHLRSWPPASVPGPAVSQFNTGDRELEIARERGSQAVLAMYREARAELVTWASTWMRVTTVNGLDSVARVWHDVTAGRSDPLSAVVIRP